MSNLLAQIAKHEQARLLEGLNYMNLEEIRGFCSERGIPYRIVAEYGNGKVKATKDTDRKPIVLARVRRYLTTGDVGQPTRIPAEIVRGYKWERDEEASMAAVIRDAAKDQFR